MTVARPVTRMAEDDDARARRQRFFEDVPRREVKAVTAAAEDGDEVESRHRREGAGGRVERLDDEDAVALVRAGEEGEEDRFAAAGRGEDLGFCQRQAEALLVVVLQRLQELRRSARRRVLEEFGVA